MKKKRLKWPVNAEQHAYMRARQAENRERSVDAEDWMAHLLGRTGLKWTRQAQWGYRIFDFWNAELGIAVEVDGPTHDPEWDSYRDEYNYYRSGILVLRVKNYDEAQAAKALRVIAVAGSWSKRRERLGLNAKEKKARRNAARVRGFEV